MEATALAELPPVTRPNNSSSFFMYPPFEPWSFFSTAPSNGTDGSNQVCQPNTILGNLLSIPNSPTLPSFPLGSPNLPNFGCNASSAGCDPMHSKSLPSVSHNLFGYTTADIGYHR